MTAYQSLLRHSSRRARRFIKKRSSTGLLSRCSSTSTTQKTPSSSLPPSTVEKHIDKQIHKKKPERAPSSSIARTTPTTTNVAQMHSIDGGRSGFFTRCLRLFEYCYFIAKKRVIPNEKGMTKRNVHARSTFRFSNPPNYFFAAKMPLVRGHM